MRMRSTAWMALATLLCAVGSDADPAQDATSRLEERIAVLTAPEMQGRGAGSPALDAAAERIASWFGDAGLQPAGDGGGWFQSFTPAGSRIADAARLPEGVEWGKITLKNVVGLLPGTGDGTVIVGAHYDHLGLDAEGRPYPGADDNASGVAALCEIAAELAREPARRRAILFVAFSGEEWGLLGSTWYVEHPIRPLAPTIAMVNLDTVGRLENRRLFVLSTETGEGLAEMARGVNLGFAFDLAVPEKGPFGSDHSAFIEKGVPGIHLFTGPNADYHRIGDTMDKLDLDGLREIASYSAEAVRFLADRDRGIAFRGGTHAEAPPPSQPMRTSRRVSLGTVPDFAWQGDGVRVDGVLPGSPAEQAGIRKGDVLVGFDGERVATLEDYTAMLRARNPGDRVRLSLLREGAEVEIEATLAERK